MSGWLDADLSRMNQNHLSTFRVFPELQRPLRDTVWLERCRQAVPFLRQGHRTPFPFHYCLVRVNFDDGQPLRSSGPPPPVEPSPFPPPHTTRRLAVTANEQEREEIKKLLVQLWRFRYRLGGWVQVWYIQTLCVSRRLFLGSWFQ